MFDVMISLLRLTDNWNEIISKVKEVIDWNEIKDNKFFI